MKEELAAVIIFLKSLEILFTVSKIHLMDKSSSTLLDAHDGSAVNDGSKVARHIGFDFDFQIQQPPLTSGEELSLQTRRIPEDQLTKPQAGLTVAVESITTQKQADNAAASNAASDGRFQHSGA